MSVTAFQDLPLAERDRAWDGAAAEKRVRSWADAEDAPNEKYRAAHVWYDNAKKDNFTAYKLLIADVVDGQLTAVPRGVIAAGNVMDGARGGVNLPTSDINRVKAIWQSITPRWVIVRRGKSREVPRHRRFQILARRAAQPPGSIRCATRRHSTHRP